MTRLVSAFVDGWRLLRARPIGNVLAIGVLAAGLTAYVSITALNALKMAVERPMPKPSAMIAPSVVPGFFSSSRSAKRRSWSTEGKGGRTESLNGRTGSFSFS